MSSGYRQAVPFKARCPICKWDFESTVSQQKAAEKAARCASQGRPTFKYRKGLTFKVPVTARSTTAKKQYKIIRCYVERDQLRHTPQYVLWFDGKAKWVIPKPRSLTSSKNLNPSSDHKHVNCLALPSSSQQSFLLTTVLQAYYFIFFFRVFNKTYTHDRSANKTSTTTI